MSIQDDILLNRSAEFENIILGHADSVTTIALNRPKVFNALNTDMILELSVALDYVRDDRDTRVLIITGGGKVFAAGADIAKMVDITPEEAKQFSFSPTFQKIEDLEIPVIAAVAGYALGGGLELALACDLMICDRTAKFGVPEVNVGIFPGAGGTQRLPRLIGSARAKEMIFTGEIIDANTAFRYGLCNKIVEGDLLADVSLFAKKLAAGPQIAIRSAKQVINSGLDMDIKAGIAFETIAWANLFSTYDQKEGMKAFLGKRKPMFHGI